MVKSNRMTKSVVVHVERQVEHPVYKKIMRRTTSLKAHDDVRAL